MTTPIIECSTLNIGDQPDPEIEVRRVYRVNTIYVSFQGMN
jgi:hypothetical protein